MPAERAGDTTGGYIARTGHERFRLHHLAPHIRKHRGQFLSLYRFPLSAQRSRPRHITIAKMKPDGARLCLEVVGEAPIRRSVVLAPLVALVGWARVEVADHSPAQVIAGSGLRIAVAAVVFVLLR